jgi:flagellar basal-body rod protein FlgF
VSGGYYIALSGMRTRLDQLDRLADEIANASTAGYKGERSGYVNAPRDTFDQTLATAIDVSTGSRSLDVRPGDVVDTGRDLDIALGGAGFLTVQTPQGTRYTRNGHLMRTTDGTLTTADGALVMGDKGPIKLGAGEVHFDEDGTVRAGATVAGKLAIVEFDNARTLVREGAALLRGDGTTAPTAVKIPEVHGGSLENSNVSTVERMAELTTVARTFEALQKAISVMLNDVDGRTIDSLGRK